MFSKTMRIFILVILLSLSTHSIALDCSIIKEPAGILKAFTLFSDQFSISLPEIWLQDDTDGNGDGFKLVTLYGRQMEIISLTYFDENSGFSYIPYANAIEHDYPDSSNDKVLNRFNIERCIMGRPTTGRAFTGDSPGSRRKRIDRVEMFEIKLSKGVIFVMLWAGENQKKEWQEIYQIINRASIRSQ